MTVHTSGQDRNHTPLPTISQRLDDAVNRIDLVRADIDAVIRDLPDDSPMWAVVDIVNGLWNLRNASVLLDKATGTLESPTGIVAGVVAR